MASPMEVDDDSIFPARYRSVPLHALRPSSRRKLGLYLNLENTTFSESGVLTDFNGLAELADFDSLEIQNFKRKENPTEAILQEWQQRPDLTPTLGRLIECLEEMGREDVLTDCMPQIRNDAQAFLNKKTKFENAEPIQDPSVTCSPAPLRMYSDHHVNEHAIITVQDVQRGCPQFYDAFVCYNPEGRDLAFVKEMLSVLESDKYSLKMFVPWRDDLPGSSTHTVSATLIQERCKRMVIIMSHEYLASPACDFQTKFAHSLSPGSRSKKLVPVLMEHCLIPPILRHVTLCDYTKGDLKEWFWDRLAWTIKAPIEPRELEYERDVVLSDICLDVSSSSSHSAWQSSPSSLPKTSSTSSSSFGSSGTSPSTSSVSSHSMPVSKSSGSFGSPPCRAMSMQVMSSSPPTVSPHISVTAPVQKSSASKKSRSSPLSSKKFPFWKRGNKSSDC